MSNQHDRPVIIIKKKKKGHGHGSHGAWKIAFADFMTAMFAFFLVMWLIQVSTPKERSRIAEYFNMPLREALSQGLRTADSSSPIPGGGDDVTQQQGEVKKSPDIDELKKRTELNRLKKLREQLDQLIEADPKLRALRAHLQIDLVQEGLRIQIIDSQNRPMFKNGSAEVEPYMHDILRSIAPLLNDIPNKISLSGHTDDLPYARGEHGYSNWELSADRANASRRELMLGGLGEGKILRVVGMASTMIMGGRGPGDAVNRRISLLVLNKEAEQAIVHENAESDSQSLSSLQELEPGAPAPVANAPAAGTPAPVANAPAAGTPAPVANAPAAATPAPVANAPTAATPAPVANAPAAATLAPVANAPAAATPAPVTKIPAAATPASVTNKPAAAAPVQTTIPPQPGTR